MIIKNNWTEEAKIISDSDLTLICVTSTKLNYYPEPIY